MRNSARFIVAGFVSALALAILPVASADAAPVHPQFVGCCR
jgi:hypothetical protein